MIQIITKEKMNQIIEHPLLDVNKGKYAVIEKDQFHCIDNSSGSAYQRVCRNIIEAVKWFNGMLT